jgi:hypothetical protein
MCFANERKLLAGKVIYKGQPYPGEDVAVIKLGFTQDFNLQDPLAAETIQQKNSYMRNSLLCLPLGNSDDVSEGMQIRALGFPDGTYDPFSMDPQEQYRSGSYPGEIGQRRRMKEGGGYYFEMSSSIYHGSSGGPVIDKSGNVIAIATAFLGEIRGERRGPQISYALPINIARKYIEEKAGLNIEACPLSHMWKEALQLYSDGHYAEACHKFDGVSYKTSLIRSGIMSDPPNSYAVEMLNRCKTKLKSTP